MPMLPALCRPCPVKLVERGPVVVEPIKKLRVDGIGHLDSPLVVGFATLGRELLLLRAVKLRKRPCDRIAGDKLIATVYLVLMKLA